ncbi:MAG: alpha-glucan family phosphorylase [Candidatus Altiarchaeota archaeon]|nr:alpha-glucan family phosphorylase [Candidatus Altiarchaeota archaeon]
MIDKPLEDKKNRVAYFSMEIGLDEKIPTYCGGLGVLAADTLKSCADLEVPSAGVTLLSEKGFFKQTIDLEGNQIEEDVEWNPREHMTKLENNVTVPIEGKKVYVTAWQHNIAGITGYQIPVIFLDTNLPKNDEENRKITWHLYGGDNEYRLRQEIVLGIGGVRMLKELGYRMRKYHMNEGHSSLLALELLKRRKDVEESVRIKKVREKCIFTTHTPIPSGHDRFQYSLVEKLLGGYIDLNLIKRYGGKEHLNMTLLGFNFSEYINGVAKKHGEVSRSMFPGYTINAITNGIHPPTWVGEEFSRLYDRHITDWRRDPFLFRYAVGVPDDEVWNAHMKEKKKLIDYVNSKEDSGLKYETLTIGFARRMTEYKRPMLVFSDTRRLRKIARKGNGLQIVFSGKAHPKDFRGKELIKEIYSRKEELKKDIRIAYIEDYDIGISKRLVSGVDLWLNTPEKPKEASGTSGMKATLNGVLNFSVLDGWWIEGCIEGITGWSIGGKETGEDDRSRYVEDLYSKLEDIMEVFYYDMGTWTKMMKNSISLNGSFFNSHRMIQQYVVNAYLD